MLFANEIKITGRVGKDAVVKTVAGNKLVSTFSLGLSVGPSTARKTVWVRCTIWGDAAQNTQNTIRRGSLILVEGKINGLYTYVNHAGESNGELQITVNKFELLEAKSPALINAVENFAESNDDIPF